MATPNALETLQQANQTPSEFLRRHAKGDWGDVSEEDQHANQEALNDGSRIFSSYQTKRNEKIWIITEAVNDDGYRASTCILIPKDY